MRTVTAESRRAAYDAVIAAPFGRLGLKLANGRLVDVNFLPSRFPLRAPRDPIAAQACRELNRYFKNPRHIFRVPIAFEGSEHAERVWRALRKIPAGTVRSYGELARKLKSSPRAIGGACRTNPIAIIIPCHRVVASNEALGGFMGKRSGAALAIKRWLLAHEQG
jgi:methylated-DNA-[protein]-cysteine S-methyltransferase